MPLFSKGSLEVFMSNDMNEEKTKMVLACATQVINNCFNAFQTVNEVSGDLFCRNIVLDEALQPVITNFKLARFLQGDNYLFWRDVNGFVVDVARHFYAQRCHSISAQLESINRQYVIMSMANDAPPSLELISQLNTAIMAC